MSNLQSLFQDQLANVKPLTLEDVQQMRATRAEVMSGEELERSLQASRLHTDEVVGRRLLFYIEHACTVNEGNGDITVRIRKLYDDELEEVLSGLEFMGYHRGNLTIPRFRRTISPTL